MDLLQLFFITFLSSLPLPLISVSNLTQAVVSSRWHVYVYLSSSLLSLFFPLLSLPSPFHSPFLSSLNFFSSLPILCLSAAKVSTYSLYRFAGELFWTQVMSFVLLLSRIHVPSLVHLPLTLLLLVYLLSPSLSSLSYLSTCINVFYFDRMNRYVKFFNHGESNADIIDWKTARVYEKLDGSIITMYWYFSPPLPLCIPLPFLSLYPSLSSSPLSFSPHPH